ncbi:Anosmin-1 [Merluccius polli]|uniref:Anosmin-1 n=1 Tax=Merluccius polli TaxID=89951 RepID=A0AA47NRX3_MERPO|nr:Anosmin-1 [Merluccius polli]
MLNQQEKAQRTTPPTLPFISRPDGALFFAVPRLPRHETRRHETGRHETRRRIRGTTRMPSVRRRPCLAPCRSSGDMETASRCRVLCEGVFPRKHWECETSCEFLRSVLTVKQGDCPPADRASGFAAACVESCAVDGECAAQRKCCANGCGHTCQSPKDLYKGVPLKPRKELGLAEVSPGVLEVRWSSRFNVSAEPVVYVLQARWNHGIQPSEDATTPWRPAAQTTDLAARLDHVRPGRWYQFRVAAVNVHGTRGFTTPSRHSRPPPPAPSDLSVVDMTFGPGPLASARLRWAAPPDPDVPVHHYRVSWSWTAAGAAGTAAHRTAAAAKRRKTVRASQMDLDGMRWGRSYAVEVQAVSYWGPTPLRGPKALLHFSTQPGGAHPAPDDRLAVGTPFFQDGRLQVRVYWKTSAGESSASLQGLRFSCRYEVLLQPLGGGGGSGGGGEALRPAEGTSFSTPACAALQAKSAEPIGCAAGDEGESHQEISLLLTFTALKFIPFMINH